MEARKNAASRSFHLGWLDRLSLCVTEFANHDHDKINQGPDPKSTERNELQYASADFSHVEAMDTKCPEKEAKQDSWNETFFTDHE